MPNYLLFFKWRLWYFATTAVHAERWCKVATCCNRLLWMDCICFGPAVRNGNGYVTVPYSRSDFSKFVGSGTLPCCSPIIIFSIIHVRWTAILKSEVSDHFKADSSHSFQPTGIGLGSLWRGNRCAYPIISEYLWIGKFYFYKFLNLFILPKKLVLFKKFHKIYYSFKKRR